MASTYQWSDIVTLVKPYVSGIPTSTLDAFVCDQLNSQIWRAGFWGWSLANLTAITLTDTTQDYVIANADFYRLFRARLTRTDITPNESSEKDIIQFLPPNLNSSGGLYSIKAVSYMGTTTARLDSAASVPSGVTMFLRGEYQTVPTKITTTAMTIVFPDHYVDCATEGLKWKYYLLAKDPRAGGITINAKTGDRQMTGQYATFMTLLKEMKEAEDLGQGAEQRFPDDPIGIGRSSNPGLFGIV